MEGHKHFLDVAFNYATMRSSCCKVAVGTALVNKQALISVGANKTLPVSCKSAGCLRVSLYGDDSKSHRNPSDCRAVHSEIDAITAACRDGISTKGSVAYVTRYPCEACARALVSAGIRKVVYGGTTEISEQTKGIFAGSFVEVQHITDWKEDNTDR